MKTPEIYDFTGAATACCVTPSPDRPATTERKSCSRSSPQESAPRRSVSTPPRGAKSKGNPLIHKDYFGERQHRLEDALEPAARVSRLRLSLEARKERGPFERPRLPDFFLSVYARRPPSATNRDRTCCGPRRYFRPRGDRLPNAFHGGPP